MYFMPEATIEQMNQQLRDVAAHEFFHIVTPLTIHSEEIGHFDFNDPKMSQHLWMYEGATEYFAGNVQVKYGLITPEQYLEVLHEKMQQMDQYDNTIPFTDLSKYTLDKYHDQYNNVYVKGALIGLCLDLKLRKLSEGKYGLRNLLLDLSKKFGKTKAFQDDQLFTEITNMTYPEIGDFFNKYVKGAEPLPLAEELSWVGVDYTPEEKFKDYSLGLSQADVDVMTYEGKPYLYIAKDDKLNEMGKMLGFKQGDILVKINGEIIPDLGPQLGEFLARQRGSIKEGKPLTFGVLRKDEKGEMKEIELAANAFKVDLSRKHVIEFNNTPTAEQLALRDSWLKP
jgi:predicted metalloprotease with PDZ domain